MLFGWATEEKPTSAVAGANVIADGIQLPIALPCTATQTTSRSLLPTAQSRRLIGVGKGASRHGGWLGHLITGEVLSYSPSLHLGSSGCFDADFLQQLDEQGDFIFFIFSFSAFVDSRDRILMKEGKKTGRKKRWMDAILK